MPRSAARDAGLMFDRSLRVWRGLRREYVATLVGPVEIQVAVEPVHSDGRLVKIP